MIESSQVSVNDVRMSWRVKNSKAAHHTKVTIAHVRCLTSMKFFILRIVQHLFHVCLNDWVRRTMYGCGTCNAKAARVAAEVKCTAAAKSKLSATNPKFKTNQGSSMIDWWFEKLLIAVVLVFACVRAKSSKLCDYAKKARQL